MGEEIKNITNENGKTVLENTEPKAVEPDTTEPKPVDSNSTGNEVVANDTVTETSVETPDVVMEEPVKIAQDIDQLFGKKEDRQKAKSRSIINNYYMQDKGKNQTIIGVIIGVISVILIAQLAFNTYSSIMLTKRIAVLENKVTSIELAPVVENKTIEIEYKDNGDISTIVDKMMPAVVSVIVKKDAPYAEVFG